MNPTQDTYRHRILKVQLHIQEHLDEDLSLERLARIAHFSPLTQIAFDAGYDTHESFSRAFRQMFGVSPSQFRAGQRPVPSIVSTGLQGEEKSMSNATTADVHVRKVDPMRVA